MNKKAWEIERELRRNAVPMDRRIHDSNWYDADFQVPYGDDLINMLWDSKVPGSGAPEIPYLTMIQAKANLGYDLSKAEALIEKGIQTHKSGDRAEIRKITAEIMAAIYEAPIDPNHSYHKYDHPDTWEDVVKQMGKNIRTENAKWNDEWTEKIYKGWIGQLAGGSFGTAIEGYTGEQITKIYGEVTDYITDPETTNDDVVYELILLDVYEKMGSKITSRELGLEWVKQIPFGWSAEMVALQNLAKGIMPPQSGSWHNPYSDWIGVQMRTMICGMLAPNSPLEAARLAWIDGVVSHSRNGVYGGIFAAVLTSLAFEYTKIRELIQAALPYLPQKSEYMQVVKDMLAEFEKTDEPESVLPFLDKYFEKYNWIHAYPNIGGVLYSLWYGQDDFTRVLSLLAKAGNDVDCSAGLVGNVLGIIYGVPEKWSAPIQDLLETYIKGKEKLSIKELALKTASLAKKHL